MSRESGEHSLSMLLVLSLWALEFCLSFMEVLRGRLCNRFSILLRKGQKMKSSEYTNKHNQPDSNFNFTQAVEETHVDIQTDNHLK